MVTDALRPRRRPPPLKAGDGVALFSPSSHTRRGDEPLIEEAAKVLEGWGLIPKRPPFPQPRHLYLAGTDQQRAAEFQSLYCDPEIKALFATRGGYGTARMLPLLDESRIAQAPPKPVVGMSDISALHAYLDRVAGVAAVHGPCLAAPGHGASPARKDNEAWLRDLLFQEESHTPPDSLPCKLLHRPAEWEGKTISGDGVLIGGNLTVLASLLATPWDLDTRGAILFLEEVNEAPYRIDRDLTHFMQAGKFDSLAGIVFGHLDGCDLDPPGLLERMLRDVFAEAPYPVATGLGAGHGAVNLALPLGAPATLRFPSGTQGPQAVEDGILAFAP